LAYARTVSGSRRSLPRTAIDRAIPDSGPGAGAAVVAGAVVGAVAGASCARIGPDQAPMMVPTRSVAPVRLPIVLDTEITRSPLFMNYRVRLANPEILVPPCLMRLSQ